MFLLTLFITNFEIKAQFFYERGYDTDSDYEDQCSCIACDGRAKWANLIISKELIEQKTVNNKFLKNIKPNHEEYNFKQDHFYEKFLKKLLIKQQELVCDVACDLDNQENKPSVRRKQKNSCKQKEIIKKEKNKKKFLQLCLLIRKK